MLLEHRNVTATAQIPIDTLAMWVRCYKDSIWRFGSSDMSEFKYFYLS